MAIESGEGTKSGQTVADAGEFVQQAGDAARSSNSTFTRAGATLAAVRLGSRLLPAARRLVARNPLAGTLLIAATIGAVVWAFSRRDRSRI